MLSQQLTKVLDKTSKLIELCLSLQEENDLLKLENQSLNVALRASRDKTLELEDKVKALSVARSLEAAETENVTINEKTLDTKKKIDDFVREIDKCITLLK
ncbi:hypothetical protein SAMN05216436_12933 [bacterium A37T11]|nr:hypothetical protein SAMN05216436_12933 [bacterium A37T11]